MGLILNDLFCATCNAIEVDCMYARGEGHPACEDCGGPRIVRIQSIKFSIRGSGHGSFTPVDMGVLGKCETREDYDRAVSRIEKRFPGHSVNIVPETTGQKQTRLDAIRHRSWEQKRKNSLNDRMLGEITEYQEAKVNEAKSKGKKAKLSSAKDLATKKAVICARKKGRSLHHVVDMPRREMAIYEDQNTGERRTVTGKARVQWGLPLAWELASPDPIFADDNNTS